MAEALLALFVIFLSVIGLSYLIMRLALFVLSDKKRKMCLTLFLQGENADMKLITFLEGLRWHCKKNNCTALAVDYGIDPKCKEYCKEIATKSGMITYLEFENYSDYIKEFIERKG